MLWPDDVPIHRDSVGAMSTVMGSQTSRTDKPYVYRGTGVDQLAHLFEQPKPKPKRRRKAKARKSYTPPPLYSRPAKPKILVHHLSPPRTFGNWRMKRIPPTTHKSWFDWPVDVLTLDEITTRRERRKPRAYVNPATNPLTGEDFDALLDSL